MDANQIESTVCFKLLSNYSGLKHSTIESLVTNDYDSFPSLLAFDLDKDLNQLPNVSMGQKSILREALILLKKEINQWIESEPKINSSISKNVFNSTPIPKPKEFPIVNNQNLFKELVRTAISDMTAANEPISDSFNEPNISSFEDKTSVDSGINANDSEVVKLSPIKKSRPSKPKKSKESLEVSENTENSKQNKSLDKTEIKNKPKKRKRKKILYSFNGRKQTKNKRKDKPLSERKTNCERRVLIDIDKQEESEPIGKTSEESNGTEIIESIQTTDESDLKSNSSLVERKANEKKFIISNPEEDLYFWKKKKLEILRLIKNNSKQIEFKKDEKKTKGLSEIFKVVVINGTDTPFLMCEICFNTNVFHLLISRNVSTLKQHLLSKRHSKDSSLLSLFGIASKEVSKSKESDDFDESDLSVEEFDSEEIDSQIDKSHRKSLIELSMKAEPKIVITKMNISFNGSDKKYLAQLMDTESENNSQIVINNYDEVFPPNKSANSSVLKPYKCDIKDCKFATAYPFSLDMHKDRHRLKSLTNSSTKIIGKKRQKFSYLQGINGYVLDYMKKNSPDSTQSFKSKPPLKSLPMVCDSSDSKYTSDCLLYNPNIESNDKTNEQSVINDKIATRIKDWCKPNALIQIN